jgi:hypothetical protein
MRNYSMDFPPEDIGITTVHEARRAMENIKRVKKGLPRLPNSVDFSRQD